VEGQSIDNDHPLDAVEQALVPPREDQPKATVQHHRLSRDHQAPSGRDNGGAEGHVAPAEVLDEEAEDIGNDAGTCQHERPEVEASIVAEGGEDKQLQLDGVVEGEGGADEDGQGSRIPLGEVVGVAVHPTHGCGRASRMPRRGACHDGRLVNGRPGCAAGMVSSERGGVAESTGRW
jgi:hypothetical protein